jgi:hypothetical protein
LKFKTQCLLLTSKSTSQFETSQEWLLTLQHKSIIYRLLITITGPSIGRTLNQYWVLIADSTNALSASSYSRLPWTWFIFFRKRWMMPRHKIWVLLCMCWVCNGHSEAYYDKSLKTHSMPPSVHYTPKACTVRHKLSWSSNWAVREKRSRQCFCTVCNKDPLLI